MTFTPTLPVPRITVSLIEDDSGIREGLHAMLNAFTRFKCVSVHPNAEHAIRYLPENKPNVALVDINLPKMSGIECVRHLKSICPTTQFLILTVYEDTDLIFESLKAGASGYLLKRSEPNRLISAIEEVHNGGAPMTAEIARRVVKSFQDARPDGEAVAALLRPRECEVLELLARGSSYREIAEQLGITFSTVNSHVKNIYERLHVRSRSQAVAKYLGK
ncbi:MAG: response regulator transcription factor [Verrucomicrobia bacterium]|nr:response regulator transcription factor [Verrucomicrobiota bacterium]MBI3868920.1 response regulator transcription factor [Verrucomicrobiota bacterium]